MGAWGPAILSDDLAADVHADYLARYDEGAAPEAIANELREAYAEERGDPDEGPVFWLALARAQWECGALDPAVLVEVEDIVASGRGLDRWREAGPKQLSKRERALETFLSQIRTSKEKPRKRRPRRLRDAVYVAGDCLALRLNDGAYGAAIVLAARRSEEGANLIGVLHFRAASPPGAVVFERREWLRKTHHAWKGQPSIYWVFAQGHRSHASALSVVGTTEVREEDPSAAESYTSWGTLFTDVEAQFAWEEEHGRPAV